MKICDNYIPCNYLANTVALNILGSSLKFLGVQLKALHARNQKISRLGEVSQNKGTSINM